MIDRRQYFHRPTFLTLSLKMITFSRTTETASKVTAIIATVTPTSSRNILHWKIFQMKFREKYNNLIASLSPAVALASWSPHPAPWWSLPAQPRWGIFLFLHPLLRLKRFINLVTGCYHCHTGIPSLEMLILTTLFSFMLMSLLTSPSSSSSSSSSSWWSSMWVMLMILLCSGSLLMI